VKYGPPFCKPLPSTGRAVSPPTSLPISVVWVIHSPEVYTTPVAGLIGLSVSGQSPMTSRKIPS
jgi:hypothetical protein